MRIWSSSRPAFLPISICSPACASRGVPVIGELELAAPFLRRANHRHHRIQRQNHHHRAHRPHPATNPASPARLAATSESRPPPWSRLRGPTSGTSSNYPASSWKPSRPFTRASPSASTSRPIISTATTLSKTTPPPSARLFETQDTRDFAVLNADDPDLRGVRRLHSRQAIYWFSLDHVGVARRMARQRNHASGRRRRCLKRARFRLRGRHNIENTLAAVHRRAAGRRRSRADRSRRPHASRASSIASNSFARSTASPTTTIRKPPTWMPRSKPSTHSTAASGSSSAEKTKAATTPSLREPLRSKARAALLIGAAAAKIAGTTRRAIPRPSFAAARWPPRCRKPIALADPGDTVLLAPACASFDQFENFEQRGRVFKELVDKLAEGNR